MTPNNTNFFDESNNALQIISNTYEDGLGKILFSGLITSIGNNAFSWCSGLTSINIPSGVTSIGMYAFYGSGLANITVLAATPPTLGRDAFNINSLPKIYVPSESVDAYKATTNWSTYADKIQAIA